MEAIQSPPSRLEFGGQIVSTETITPRVRLFRVKPLVEAPPPRASAGAHVDIEVDLSGRREWRSYSLINHVSSGEFYEFAVQREQSGKGGSNYLHDTVGPGSVVRLRAPANNFSLSAAADSYLLIAGGIGVTPILAMAQELVARAAQVRAIFCARTAADAPFLAEIKSLLGTRLEVNLDAGDPKKFTDFSRVLGSRRRGEHLYMCGPNAMMTRIVDLASYHSWPAAAVHRETFDPTKGDDSSSFVAHLARTKVTVEVPAGVSLLDALLTAGHEPFYDCRRGECGLCVVDVLSGEISHRDSYLRPDERDCKMCTCVSRAAGPDVTLDM
nr:PDR/VanB family oxidoreductase [Bradyrhizobium tropiciagri]